MYTQMNTPTTHLIVVLLEEWFILQIGLYEILRIKLTERIGPLSIFEVQCNDTFPSSDSSSKIISLPEH